MGLRGVRCAASIGLLLTACGGGSGGPSDASGGQSTDASVHDGGDARAMYDARGEDASETGEPDSGGGLEGGTDAAGDADAGIPALACATDPTDPYEPNETEVTATPLASIDDCDSSGTTLTAVSAGTGDVDWYHYTGTDTVSCIVDPTLQIDAAGLRACIFIICPEGVTTVQGCTGGSPATSPAGTPGCCTTSTTSMTVQLSCGGLTTTSNSADVYMRVDQPSQDQCVAYDVAYHF